MCDSAQSAAGAGHGGENTMIKIIGFILVTLGSAVFGFSQAADMKLRALELRDIAQGFSRLEGEVCHMQRPLPEALYASGIGASEEVFRETATGIEEGKTPQKAWEDALERSVPAYHMNLKDIEVLLRFGENLSAEDTQGQAKNLTMMKSLLEERIAEAEAVGAREGKIYRSGGILVGLMIAIILL